MGGGAKKTGIMKPDDGLLSTRPAPQFHLDVLQYKTILDQVITIVITVLIYRLIRVIRVIPILIARHCLQTFKE